VSGYQRVTYGTSTAIVKNPDGSLRDATPQELLDMNKQFAKHMEGSFVPTAGVCLKATARPVADLSESSLETVEINVPERPALPPGTITYRHLPVECDLCVAAVEWAVSLLPHQEVSCDLWVSRSLASDNDNVARNVLDLLGPNHIVNRLRFESSLRPNEWFIESGDGNRVGSAPPE
jgi:hypothetical protein